MNDREKIIEEAKELRRWSGEIVKATRRGERVTAQNCAEMAQACLDMLQKRIALSAISTGYFEHGEYRT